MSDRPLRLLLGAFGDPGHAFPMIELGRALAARGHEVTLQSWMRWQEAIQTGGMAFAPAPEYRVFPTAERPLQPYQTVVRAAAQMRPLVRELRPDLAVADILTLAPALAAEAEGVEVATLVPHVFPPEAPGAPPYSLGARLPRTAVGRAVFNGLHQRAEGGYRRGRAELNETRRRLGLGPVAHLHAGISRRLALVATLPQLEYPREWPEAVHVVGPLGWEPPASAVSPPPGEGPVVLIAPSTSQDPTHRLLRTAVTGLAGEPVRVIAALNRGPLPAPLPVAGNVRLVDWLSYAQTMPRCDLVVCHGGHGTMTRALASGCPVVVVPAAGDMNENAARAAWSGAGVRLPWRLLGPRTLRLAVRQALGDPRLAARAGEMARWAAAHRPAERAAALVEAAAGGAAGSHATAR